MSVVKDERSNGAVCVVGMGYVGLTLAITLREEGLPVYGVDINHAVVSGINTARPHFYERGLEELLQKHRRAGFSCFQEIPRDIQIDTYIIAVGTSVRHKKPDFKELRGTSMSIGKRLRRGNTVILRSTVPVGSTREFVVRILEDTSGLRAGKDFWIAFAPERTVEGEALSELRTLPQIVGGFDAESATRAAQIFNLFSPKVVIVNSLEEAEMVKLLNNTYRDYSFAFANEFALACDVFNLDAAKIIQMANREYPRDKIPLPSPGVGGYCLTKDPHILHYSVKRRGYVMKLPRRARAINEEMPRYVYRQVVKFFKTHHTRTSARRISILGFAFKGNPPTSDVRFSPTLDVLQLLKEIPGVKLFGHDFVVSSDVIARHGAEPIEEVRDIFKNKHVVIVMNNHPGYRKLPIVHHLMEKPALLFDTWSLFPKEDFVGVKGLHYSNLGHDTI